MSEYLKTIVSAIMLVSLICSILPKESGGKMVSFSVGLIIILLTVSPALKFVKSDIYKFSDIKTEELIIKPKDYIMDEFEKNLALKIKENLNSNTDVTVYGKTDREGNVAGVEKVKIYPYNEDVAEKISNLLEIEKAKVVEDS